MTPHTAPDLVVGGAGETTDARLLWRARGSGPARRRLDIGRDRDTRPRHSAALPLAPSSCSSRDTATVRLKPLQSRRARSSVVTLRALSSPTDTRVATRLLLPQEESEDCGLAALRRQGERCAHRTDRPAGPRELAVGSSCAKSGTFGAVRARMQPWPRRPRRVQRSLVNVSLGALMPISPLSLQSRSGFSGLQPSTQTMVSFSAASCFGRSSV